MKAFPFLIFLICIFSFLLIYPLRAKSQSVSVTAYVQPQISYIIDGDFIIISTNESSGILFLSSNQRTIFPQTSIRVKARANRNFLATVSF